MTTSNATGGSKIIVNTDKKLLCMKKYGIALVANYLGGNNPGRNCQDGNSLVTLCRV